VRVVAWHASNGVRTCLATRRKTNQVCMDSHRTLRFFYARGCSCFVKTKAASAKRTCETAGISPNRFDFTSPSPFFLAITSPPRLVASPLVLLYRPLFPVAFSRGRRSSVNRSVDLVVSCEPQDSDSWGRKGQEGAHDSR